MSSSPVRHLVYLSLGSNLGDRLANLHQAICRLPSQVEVITASRVYETPPWGFLNQPAFLNQVVEARTALPPSLLLEYVKGIEAEMGRMLTFRYGPRSIDIDILLYDDLQLNTPELVIPHARLAERAFVLVPLAEMAAERVPPGMQLSVAELAAAADQSGIHVYKPGGKA